MDDARARPGAEIGGRFVLREKLGSGTYGSVWSADDEARSDAAGVSEDADSPGLRRRRVALKLLNATRRGHAVSVERFRREAEILARLDHPSIVRAYAWAIDADLAWLAMDQVEGAPLAALVGARAAADQPLTGAEVIGLLAPIAAALAHAHAHGVVHRDLKPRNVVVGPPPRRHVTVLDFGIAKLVDTPAGEATTVGRMLGSLLFMSPEQLGAGAVDARTDVFALATVAFELLTLHRAWALDASGRGLRALDEAVGRDPVNNHTTVAARILRGPRPSACAHRPELPAAVDAVLEAAWAVDAAARPADPRVVVARLAAALGVEDGAGDVAAEAERAAEPQVTAADRRPPPGVSRRPHGAVLRGPRRAARTLLALGLGAALVTLWWTSDHRPPSTTDAAGDGRIEPSSAAPPVVVRRSPRPSPASTSTGAAPVAAGADALRPGLAASETARAAPAASEAAPAASEAARREGPRSALRPRPARSAGAASPGASVAPAASSLAHGPSPALRAELRRLAAIAHARGDGPAIADAAEAVLRAAATVADPVQRRRVQRLADGARLNGQLADLDAASSALDDAIDAAQP